MPPLWNENRLTAKLGIDYPIIQGPLGGLRIDQYKMSLEERLVSNTA
jgi:NAD(P)H-dependent flavin oxidoreductase YrpB (nitropropane dioxygenase family)